MIQFQNVVKQYPGNDFALGEINFHIEEGEFVFLIGPSGSGKTTIIRLLIREEKPTAGKIYIDDYDITRISRGNVYRLRRQMGVVFQDYKLISDKNVYENVAFAMEAAGRRGKDIKDTVPYVLDIVGLTQRINAFPAQLSGGEKQRVAIARAIANNPRVLIADEPTGNLDPAAAWDIVQILSKINNWGTTVIMSTHGTDIVNSLNKRVIQMKGGQVVRDDNRGFYERTESGLVKPTDSDMAPESEAPDRKGPIQVKIKPTEEIVEAEKPKFSWFSFGKKKQSAAPTDEPAIQEVLAEPEVAPKEVEELKQKVDDNEAEKIAADAKKISITRLELPAQVIADLQVAGYTDMDALIEAGPEELGKQLVIDPEEVVLVAKAIAKFVQEEEEQERPKGAKTKELKPKKERSEPEGGKAEEKSVESESQKPAEETAPKSEDQKAEEPKTESKAKRVKINLTGAKMP